MLLAFVLLGRAVEERAKLRASSDMTALLTLLPAHARLLLPGQGTRTLTVLTHHLSPGDRVVVLPGVSLPFAPHGCRQAMRVGPGLGSGPHACGRSGGGRAQQRG